MFQVYLLHRFLFFGMCELCIVLIRSVPCIILRTTAQIDDLNYFECFYYKYKTFVCNAGSSGEGKWHLEPEGTAIS